jgi:hypothetical protein
MIQYACYLDANLEVWACRPFGAASFEEAREIAQSLATQFHRTVWLTSPETEVQAFGAQGDVRATALNPAGNTSVADWAAAIRQQPTAKGP